MTAFTIPREYQTEAAKALREYLGDDADGLTDANAINKACLRFVKGEVRRVARRSATSQAVADADSAMALKEVAAVTAIQVRKDAENAEDAAVEAAFGGGS
jgi:hypothetical protein